MILGDLGAEVIKVERPRVGDDTRSIFNRSRIEFNEFEQGHLTSYLRFKYLSVVLQCSCHLLDISRFKIGG